MLYDDLIKRGNQLFTDRMPLLSLWQEMGDHFYPERALFTRQLSLGEDFASHLTTSIPLLIRRDLGNNLSSMIRPQSTQWFKIAADEEQREDNAANRWMEWAAGVMRRAMYDSKSRFVRSTKEADHDYITFGNAVLSLEPNRNFDGLLYRCWHLRDVVWCENENGEVDETHRNWNPPALELRHKFGDKISDKAKQQAIDNPHERIKVRHIVMSAENYNSRTGGKKWNTPWVSLYIECDGSHVIEEQGIHYRFYIIPRWQTVSGSQYAYSPATIAGLPDARLIQAITLVLLEAGQKAVDPPMVATQQAIRSDLGLYAGGITFVDASYDERLGAALRPINQDYRGLPFGLELKADTRATLMEAFYLNKIALPPIGPDMTAYEVQQRVQEYVRQAMPVFEPIESEYNAPLCNETFDLMMRMGAFGSIQDLPESLQGSEIRFRFESPLQESEEREKGQRMLEVKSLLREAAEIDPSAVSILNVPVAVRDALKGIGTPSKWLRSEQEVAAAAQQAQAKQMEMQQLEQVSAMAGIAEQAGAAGVAINEAMAG